MGPEYSFSILDERLFTLLHKPKPYGLTRQKTEEVEISSVLKSLDGVGKLI